ncbi:sorting nexin-like protein-41 [Lineolata rhizophorae]|uniref:Sorting nexin-like protein-41 n=1 Tax=Lineolata rhizophorae TaxID=578093 RepID=A0A6A6NXS2_9PEZI|nr:sorting nexin-like protein-41 [Lineolata rhizophorae]
MWDDEDNNPYGSLDRRDSENSHPGHLGSPGAGFQRPETPPSGISTPRDESPEFVAQPGALSDVDYDEEIARAGSAGGAGSGERRRPPKKGGYDSRIEQILYEFPDQPILITHAGKNLESGGSYIAYTIRTGDLEVRRRYSEFASLRQTLVNLHPTLIIPPIPEKHSMADYAAKPTKAKEDVGIIELRKRMLAVFLNRCRKMDDVREDGVWWRFLDPNASWNEVLHSHPVSSIPKNVLKAPPLDTANPTPAHAYLPVPSSSAKLKPSTTVPSGTPASPPSHAASATAAAHTIPGPQIFGKFPPSAKNLSEEELDPYFMSFEASSRELETLLQGSMEKVNRRLLAHLASLGDDLAELGARYNGFALSEQAPSLAAAIERVGQSADSTYLQTAELSAGLSAGFAEPMRESAQFAGVVRAVLRYRVLKRIQEEQTRDELAKKRALLENLERSEMEARRIEQYLSSTTGSGAAGSPAETRPRRSGSSASQKSDASSGAADQGAGAAATGPPHRPDEDVASIDSDFPPTHGEPTSPGGGGRTSEATSPTTSPTKNHRKSSSAGFGGGGGGGGGGNFVTNKIFGRISHAVHGIVDVDPERTRRDQIGKTRESLVNLEQALDVASKDVKDASAAVLADLKRFQMDKEDDLKRYMIAFAKCHIDWARRNQQTWEEAKAEVGAIEPRQAA